MTPDQMKRKLAAILSADVKGYSRLMGEDEEGTIRVLKDYMEVISGFLQQHRGCLVATGGDSVLAEFASVVDAVRCAVGIQEDLKERNKDAEENRRMEFRIGVNLGDVVEEGDTILGDGVNIAARVQSLAEASGICITGTAYDQIKNKLALGYEYVGEQTAKNIKEPVKVYRILMDPGVKIPEMISPPVPEEKKSLRKRLSPAVLAVLALVLIAFVAVLYLFAFRPSASKMEVASKEKMAFALPDKPSIAVLPFVNMSGDPKQEFFSDGITEDIITTLSKVQNLFVIARNSTFTYKGKLVKIKQVSEELGVRYVLEGSVQKSGDRVRITAQLIDALSGHHLWSERYDRDLKDLFALQDEVTLRILKALQVKLTEGELISAPGEKFFSRKQGLETYLKIWETIYNVRLGNIEGNNKARRIGEEIVIKWPDLANVYILLGWTHINDLWFGSTKSPRESLEKAMELAQKGLAIDDSLPGPHSLLATIYSQKGEYDKGVAEGERAVVLDPNGSSTYELYGVSLNYAGRYKEAMPVFQKAIRLNPIGGVMTYVGLGFSYWFTGRLEEAVMAWKQALRRNPDHLISHLNLAATYIEMGREKEARAEAAEALRINPKFSLDNYAKVHSVWKDRSEIDRRYLGNLRKAGLKLVCVNYEKDRVIDYAQFES
jgi:adenylate cyclase